jgi:hypothetical protein
VSGKLGVVIHVYSRTQSGQPIPLSGAASWHEVDDVGQIRDVYVATVDTLTLRVLDLCR